MSRTGDLLGAIVAELKTINWGEPATIGHTYLPEVDRTELATLHVAVVVQSMALESLTRKASRWVYRVDVGLQKRVDPADTTAIDKLIGLMESVDEHFLGRSLSTLPGAVCTGCENEPPYSPEHLAKKRVFTGVTTLTISLAV